MFGKITTHPFNSFPQNSNSKVESRKGISIWMKQLVTSHPCIFGKTFQNLTHIHERSVLGSIKNEGCGPGPIAGGNACTFTLQIPLGVWSLGKCIQGIHLHTHRPLITQWLILSGSAHSIPVCWHTYYRYRIRQHLCKYTNWTSALWNVCVCSIDQKQSRCTCSRCLLLNCNHHSSALDVW